MNYAWVRERETKCAQNFSRKTWRGRDGLRDLVAYGRMILKWMWEWELNSNGSRQDPLAGCSCTHGNGSSVTVQGCQRNFWPAERLSASQLLYKGHNLPNFTRETRPRSRQLHNWEEKLPSRASSGSWHWSAVPVVPIQHPIANPAKRVTLRTRAAGAMSLSLESEHVRLHREYWPLFWRCGRETQAKC
jgi:hypothetical protein